MPSAGNCASITDAGSVNSILRLGPNISRRQALVTTGAMITSLHSRIDQSQLPRRVARRRRRRQQQAHLFSAQRRQHRIRRPQQCRPTNPASHNSSCRAEPDASRVSMPVEFAIDSRPGDFLSALEPHTAPANCAPCHPPSVAEIIQPHPVDLARLHVQSRSRLRILHNLCACHLHRRRNRRSNPRCKPHPLR